MSSKQRSFGLDHLIPREMQDDFERLHWDQVPHLYRRGAKNGRPGGLDIDQIGKMLASGPTSLLLGNPRGETGFVAVLPEEAVDMDKILRRIEQGSLLLVERADREIPELAEACRALTAELGFIVQATVLVAPREIRPAPLYNRHCGAFLVGIFGHSILHLAPERTARPDRRSTRRQLVQGVETHAIDLGPGDTVYLPRGWTHRTEARSEGVVTMALDIDAPSWAMVAGEETPVPDGPLGDLVPFGWLDSLDDELVQQLLRRWPGNVDTEAAREIIRQAKIAEVRRFTPDLTGRLGAILRDRVVQPDTEFSARDDLMWLIEDRPHSTRLICGPMTLDFPAGAGDALRLALTSKRIQARDLPGPLSIDDNIALLNTLHRWCLVQ